MISLKLAEKTISTDLNAFVMGIVNATPDSFWEKSRGGAEDAFRLIDEGADILDIGGESTRPGSAYVSEEEEIKRVIPVIEEIRKKSDIPVSVDTRKMSVFKAAYEAGADILNDVSALEDSPELADFCAEKKVPVILMHKRGIPVEMQNNTDYKISYIKIYYDDRGRVTWISDGTGTNCIKFQYSDGKNVITDSMGRIIECSKAKGLIKKIDITSLNGA